MKNIFSRLFSSTKINGNIGPYLDSLAPSTDCEIIIKNFLGMVECPAMDAYDTYVIGYGHTRNVKKNMPCLDESGATDLLWKDLDAIGKKTRRIIRQVIIDHCGGSCDDIESVITQSVFDCFVLFGFFYGLRNLDTIVAFSFLNNDGDPRIEDWKTIDMVEFTVLKKLTETLGMMYRNENAVFDPVWQDEYDALMMVYPHGFDEKGIERIKSSVMFPY